MQKQMTPIQDYPVLFWYCRMWLCLEKRREQMQRELDENVIYKN